MRCDPSEVAVLVPAFNEAGALGNTLTDLVGYGFSIICIDDGSSDSTRSIAQSSGAVVISHLSNLGQGAALETGFEYVRRSNKFRFIVTFDADGQHNPQEIMSLIEALELSGLDVILGSRFLNATYQSSKIKKFLLRSAAYISRYTIGLRLTDRHNGLRVFRREALFKVYLLDSGFGHADEILHLIKEHGLLYKEMPITIKYTDYSKSKGQPLINIVNIIFDRMFRYK